MTKEIAELDQNDKLVREYRADGYLYVYRDGDEYVVVSRGREPQDQWTKRVPRYRTAVIKDMQLWAIPDNWEHEWTVTPQELHGYTSCYHIPETGVDVTVEFPEKCRIVNAWVRVDKVGELKYGINDFTDKTAIPDHLETIKERWDVLEQELIDDMEWLGSTMLSEEVLTGESFVPSGGGPNNGWSFDPWVGTTWDFTDILQDVCDIDDDDVWDVQMSLRRAGAIEEPTYHVFIEDREPNGYDVQALIEAGCSPAEAVDYLMCEVLGSTQSSWAETRKKDQSTISGNVSNARNKCKR